MRERLAFLAYLAGWRLVRALPEIPASDSPDIRLLSADILPGWTAAWIAVERERFLSKAAG